MTPLRMSADAHYAIFSSGHGSNARALISCGKRLNRLPAIVLSTQINRDLEAFCKDCGCEYIHIPPSKSGQDLVFEKCVQELLIKNAVSWVFLAGFMKILSAEFINWFKGINEAGEILNIHPSLLPLYPGLKAYERSYANRDELYGHSIHRVTDVVDGGEVILQKKLLADFSLSLEEYIQVGKAAENLSYAHLLGLLLKEEVNTPLISEEVI